ncbi:alpha/beta fold hydrolase [Oceanicella actignis]|uniref:alpha/beta fold hydrolase n=1 Tax=Oceanicella actignis TaxID=1189325 RepID=UPI0011E61715|nr:alpha/beta hydrolase [Oceanicella actignis]TYO85200.1 alpha-beta hydrolase superfamily lysophospholipase [Oceanicella actignis]
MSAPPILYAGPAHARRPLDLIFVHGMGAGAWIWERATIPYFVAQGYRCWAPDLASAQERAQRRGGLDLYARRIARAIRAAGRPAVVIAHSLGAAAAQNALRMGAPMAGLALMCPAPPYGMARAGAQLMLRSPQDWRALAALAAHGPRAAAAERLIRLFLPRGADPELLAWLAANLRDEPWTPMVQALGLRPFAPPPFWLTPWAPRPPVLTLAGGRDPITPPLDAAATALWHGGRAHVLPEAGHLMMLEPDSARAAHALLAAWLEEIAAQPRRPNSASRALGSF